ncbi:MAG: hypothetical protein LBP67_07450 [Bacteroidales bacterium]|jgi:hypothetical protein|nr:hypothetical protein [Bacteroidales bacterium]
MKNINIVLILTLLLFFSSCDNSINLATDWEETTVVYTFLDHNDSISYIKVTKAFLANDNILTLAGIRDSSEYENISVTLEKYNNGTLVKIFDFEPVEIDNKDSGIFYSPYQTVYAAVTYNELDALYTTYPSKNSYTYKVRILNNSGEEVGATIPLVSETMNLRLPVFNPTSGDPGTVSFLSSKDHKQSITWDTITNGYYTNVSAEIIISELLKNGDTIRRIIPWNNLFSVTNANENLTNGRITKDIQSASFFSMMLRSVLYSDQTQEDAVDKRRLDYFTLIFKSAGKAYYEYLSMANMSTGLNQDVPNYTNVENGLGLITSRIAYRYQCVFSDATKAVLYDGYEYDGLKFSTF